MTSVFSADGKNVPCTVIEVGPCVVTQVKTVETDGYEALQLGFIEKKEKHTTKPESGHFKKAGVAPQRHLAEFKGFEGEYKPGDTITVANLFADEDFVDVIGTSKGRGYAGTIKRWGGKIGPKGHGSGYHRQQGSFANNGRCNNRVIPGKHMSGHMGNKSATILNQLVIEANADKNYILIRGSVPGAKKSIVTIRSAVKVQLGKPEEVKTLAVVEKGE